MASAFSHAIVAFSLGKVPQNKIFSWDVLLWGIFCSVIPDLDVIGFHYGVQYGDLWGHRGMTHSLFFAGILSALIVGAFYSRKKPLALSSIFLYLFLSTVSHGLLDAITNGGMGVAFFSPINTKRYFFDFRPIMVSPIGVHKFFSERAVQVLSSEVKWVWLPSIFVLLVSRVFQIFRLRVMRDQ